MTIRLIVGLMCGLGLAVPITPAHAQAVEDYALSAATNLKLASYALAPEGAIWPRISAETAKAGGHDMKAAAAFLLKDAHSGEATSELAMAKAYDDVYTSAPARNTKEAANWYLLAAKDGSAEAASGLAHLYAGDDVSDGDYALAYQWTATAASLGDSYAVMAMAAIYSGDPKSTTFPGLIAQFQEEADHDDAQAQYALCWIYGDGIGVESDRDKAEAYCQQAADQGHAAAETRLGLMLLRKDPANAQAGLKWMQKGAEQGLPYSQSTYGAVLLQYLNPDLSTSQKLAEEQVAYNWQVLAANQGYGMAQMRLCEGALMTKSNDAAIKDVRQFYFWCGVSKATPYYAGQVTAYESYLTLNNPTFSLGTPYDNAETEEADARAKSWLDAHPSFH